MQGSMAITPSPFVKESFVFRQKLGLSLTSSVLQRSSDSNICGGTARCLFGAPDPKQAKDVVREVELKNALNFGKRYNFDIVNGEPFPHAKKMKLVHHDDSDEENVNVPSRVNKDGAENDNEEGYIWTEAYDQDYMAKCNKHAVNTSIVGPNRNSAVPLLFAPTLHSNHRSSPGKSTLSSKSTRQTEESPNLPSSSQSESSCENKTVNVPYSRNLVCSSETNNNNNKSHSTSSGASISEKKLNRINANSCNSHQNSQHLQPPTKKSSLSTAHHILTKYTNRVVKTAVQKPAKSTITDYLHVKRTVKSTQPSSKQ